VDESRVYSLVSGAGKGPAPGLVGSGVSAYLISIGRRDDNRTVSPRAIRITFVIDVAIAS
jgi:hypothetical protein